MRWCNFIVAALVATLAACGGGGDQAESAPIATNPQPEVAQPPAVDPTQSWAMKPMLGTWTGTLPQVVDTTTYPGPSVRELTLVVTSQDGARFNVSWPGSNFPDEENILWAGEMAFSLVRYDTLYSYLVLDFKVVADKQAEVTIRRTAFSHVGGPGSYTQTWKGVLTRGA